MTVQVSVVVVTGRVIDGTLEQLTCGGLFSATTVTVTCELVCSCESFPVIKIAIKLAGVKRQRQMSQKQVATLARFSFTPRQVA